MTFFREFLFCSLLLILSSSFSSAASPAAWEAYNDHRLAEALKLFNADLKKNPNDLDALFGWIMLSGTVEGSASYLDISEHLLDMDELPVEFVDAFKLVLFPSIVPKKDQKRMLKIYDRMLARPDISRDIKLNIVAYKSIYTYIDGEQQLSLDQLDEAMPTIMNWSFSGSFPNNLGSGFNREHGPLEHPEASAKFTDSEGNTVGWTAMRNYIGDLGILNNYLVTDNSTVFTQSFISMPKAGTYRLNFAYAGDIKLWVDDVLVYEEEEERHTDMGHQDAIVTLDEGPHRLLLQIGNAELSGMRFMVHVFDDGGNPVMDFESSATMLPYKKGRKFDFSVEESEVFRSAAKLANSADATSAQQQLHMFQLLHQGYYLEARALLNRLNDQNPYSPAMIIYNTRLLSSEGNESGLAEYTGKHLERHPNSTQAITNAIQEALKESDHDKIDKYSKELEDLLGETSETILFKVAVKFMRNEVNAGVSMLQRARKLFPSSTELKDFDISVTGDMYNDVSQQIKIQEAYLDDYFTDDEYAYLARLYKEANKPSESIKIYKTLLDYSPGSISYRLALVRILKEQKQYKEALAQMDESILQAPYASHFYNMRGEILLLMEKENDALKDFEKSLSINNSNYDLRARIRRIRGEENPMDLMDTVNIEAIMEQQLKAEMDGDHPITILSDEVRRVVYPDGASQAKYQLLYRVLNDRGIEILKEYSLGGVKILKAKIIREDGTKINGEISGGQVVFPKLAVGDFIFLEYLESEYNSGKFRGHFWSEYSFNSWYPCLSTRYQMIVPKGFEFTSEMTGLELEPTVKDIGESNLYTWAKKDLPLRKDESYSPVIPDKDVRLHLSTIPDWNFIRDWYDDLSSARTKADYAVKQKVKELFPDGYESVDEEERIRRIYEFIASTVEYSSLSFRQSAHVPQRASKTLSDQLGDCKDVSSLFVAMAGEVDVDADLVLVDTRNNGKHHSVLPSMEFNHCIVQLTKTGDFLELTDKYLPVSTMNNGLVNSVALPITDQSKAEIVFIPEPEKRNGFNVLTKAKLIGSDMVFNRVADYYGYPASKKRSANAGESEENKESNLRKIISYRIEKPFELQSYKYENLYTLGDTVSVTADVKVKGAVSKIQKIRVIELPWAGSDTSLDFLSEDERETDLHLWKFTDMNVENEEIRLELPANSTLTELPESVTYEVPGLFYSLTFKKEGGLLVANRTVKLSKDVFTPAEYAKVKEWFFQSSEADHQLIGI